MIEEMTITQSAPCTPRARYCLKKVFQFIRQMLKDRYCCKGMSEKKTILRLAETRLSDFIYRMTSRFYEKGREFERLKRLLRRAAWNEEAAYQAEVLINKLDEYYALSSIIFIRKEN